MTSGSAVSFSVDSNFTEETPIIWPVDKGNVKNPNDRDAGSLEGYTDGNQINVEVLDSGGFLKLRVGTDHSTSSWDEGSHTAAITYTVTESSSTCSTGGGSTIINEGDSGPAEPKLLFTPTAFDVGYGNQRVRTMKVENYFNDNITAELSIPTASEEPQCQYFELQNRKGVGLRTEQSFGKKGVYRIGPAAEGVTGAFEDLQVNVRVSMPDEAYFERSTASSLRCPVSVDAEKVVSEELVLQARPVPSAELPGFSFFSNLGLPSTDFQLFQDVCTNVEANTAEGEAECPEGEQFSLNASPVGATVAATAGLLLVGGVVAMLYFRNLLKAIWKLLPF